MSELTSNIKYMPWNEHEDNSGYIDNVQKMVYLKYKLNEDQREIFNELMSSFCGQKSEGFLIKTGFSASALFYEKSSGQCARRWDIAFSGAEQEKKYSHISLRRMESGTASHADLQQFLINKYGDNIEIEKEFFYENPSMHGFVDAYLPGPNIPIEIKTAGPSSFAARITTFSGIDYQEHQLLIYMYMLKAKMGILLYEERESFHKVAIPVIMTQEKYDAISKSFEWMRKIEEARSNGDHIKQFSGKRINSVMCRDCEFKEICENSFPEGTVELPLLKKYMEPASTTT